MPNHLHKVRPHWILYLGMMALQVTGELSPPAFAGLDASPSPTARPGVEPGRIPQPAAASRPIRIAQAMRDSRTGVQVYVPTWLRGAAQTRRYGTNWSGANGGIEIDTLRYEGRSCLDDTYRNVRRAKRGEIYIDALGQNEWTLAGREPSEGWWVKMAYRSGECRGLSVVLSEEKISGSVDLMRSIAESFVAFPD
jgi:hypothetical protein